MNRSLQIKLLVVVVVAGWSLWSLWPTIQQARGIEGLPAEKQAKIESRAIKQGLDLKGGMYLVLELDETQLQDLDRGEAMARVVEILRNRIDQFGVSEPVIQNEGNQRIVIQLPGLQDAERAKRLIGSTARLEFRLVREGGNVNSLITRLDRALSGQEDGASVVDSTSASAADGSLVDPLTGQAISTASNDRPFGSLVGGFDERFGGILVESTNVAQLKRLLASDAAQRVLPRDAELLWGREDIGFGDGITLKVLYLVETEVRLEGAEIETADVTPDPNPARPGKLQVSLDLTKRGGLRFSNVTGANVNRKLGIVLDDIVHSAPNIIDKISGGRATISGGFARDEEARDLALMLRAGALPVDVHIEEERTVGPTLGRDSIQKGIRSVVIGGIAVVVFMMIYYRAAGVLATSGLLLTLLALLGILAQFKLTLTLPGIAGIILTVGMAVDANVLIFERIREEMRAGRTVRGAIDAGYALATRTIVDANITTLIAAFVLLFFGTGPIRGFAVTLAVGIVTSMFSALIFTRSVYELWLGNRSPKSLSI
jgi:protein-export membrane protein SecD